MSAGWHFRRRVCYIGGMKEIRPSTWVVLGMMMLLIFAPVFFIDLDDLQAPRQDQPHDPNLKPHNPSQPFNKATGPLLPGDTVPPPEKPPAEKPPEDAQPPADPGEENSALE